MSNDVILVAGTKLEMEVTAGVWQRVPKMKSIGAIGEQSEPKEKTTLEDRIKTYGSGLRDAPDKNVQGQYIPKQESGDEYYDDYVLQQAFITRCRNEEEFNLRVVWPDAEVNGFLFKSLGFEWDDSTQEDWKMFTCNGKQNSRMVFGATVTGTDTIAAAATTQLSLAVVPATLVLSEYQDDIVWSSSDEAVATVDANGLVTGVSAGTTTITAEVRGVPGTIEITVTA